MRKSLSHGCAVARRLAIFLPPGVLLFSSLCNHNWLLFNSDVLQRHDQESVPGGTPGSIVGTDASPLDSHAAIGKSHPSSFQCVLYQCNNETITNMQTMDHSTHNSTTCVFMGSLPLHHAPLLGNITSGTTRTISTNAPCFTAGADKDSLSATQFCSRRLYPSSKPVLTMSNYSSTTDTLQHFHTKTAWQSNVLCEARMVLAYENEWGLHTAPEYPNTVCCLSSWAHATDSARNAVKQQGLHRVPHDGTHSVFERAYSFGEHVQVGSLYLCTYHQLASGSVAHCSRSSCHRDSNSLLPLFTGKRTRTAHIDSYFSRNDKALYHHAANSQQMGNHQSYCTFGIRLVQHCLVRSLPASHRALVSPSSFTSLLPLAVCSRFDSYSRSVHSYNLPICVLQPFVFHCNIYSSYLCFACPVRHVGTSWCFGHHDVHTDLSKHHKDNHADICVQGKARAHFCTSLHCHRFSYVHEFSAATCKLCLFAITLSVLNIASATDVAPYHQPQCPWGLLWMVAATAFPYLSGITSWVPSHTGPHQYAEPNKPDNRQSEPREDRHEQRVADVVSVPFLCPPCPDAAVRPSPSTGNHSNRTSNIRRRRRTIKTACPEHTWKLSPGALDHKPIRSLRGHYLTSEGSLLCSQAVRNDEGWQCCMPEWTAAQWTTRLFTAPGSGYGFGPLAAQTARHYAQVFRVPSSLETLAVNLVAAIEYEDIATHDITSKVALTTTEHVIDGLFRGVQYIASFLVSISILRKFMSFLRFSGGLLAAFLCLFLCGKWCLDLFLVVVFQRPAPPELRLPLLLARVGRNQLAALYLLTRQNWRQGINQSLRSSELKSKASEWNLSRTGTQICKDEEVVELFLAHCSDPLFAYMQAAMLPLLPTAKSKEIAKRRSHLTKG